MVKPRIEWCDINSRKCVVVHFSGHLTAEDARDAVESLGPRVEELPGRLVMVWDCTGMSDYESAAREVWQQFVKTIKGRLEAVHLISTSSAVRLGASMVGLFAGIKVRTWESFEEFRTNFLP